MYLVDRDNAHWLTNNFIAVNKPELAANANFLARS